MAPKKPRQAAAVCYRLRDRKPEFLLVQAKRRSGSNPRWIFPKGKVEEGERPWKAAAREAEEEAGVTGEVIRKRLATFRLDGSEVDAYLLKIKDETAFDKEGRARGWFRRHKAVKMLAQNRDGKSILALTGVLSAAWHAVSPSGRSRIFLSYSRKDKKWLDRLQTVLKPLAVGRKVVVWDDRGIKPGELWRKKLKEVIATSKIAVLLVSHEFLASDFIAEEELPALRRAARRGDLRIMWIALRPCDYKRARLSDYQAVNDPAKPLALHKKGELDRELEGIRQKIEDALEEETEG